ncbi:hypothetical protein PFISCL1PPCAC_11361, partial [Pristionchus fissidentatus]
ESTPQTTTAPPPLMPTVPANKHGILIWMCQNSEVLKIVDEVCNFSYTNVTDLPSLTKDVYDRLNEYRPNGLWAVYSTKYTTRSTANLLSNDGESFPSALCFVQFHENPQILVVANLAEVI